MSSHRLIKHELGDGSTQRNLYQTTRKRCNLLQLEQKLKSIAHSGFFRSSDMKWIIREWNNWTVEKKSLKFVQHQTDIVVLHGSCIQWIIQYNCRCQQVSNSECSCFPTHILSSASALRDFVAAINLSDFRYLQLYDQLMRMIRWKSPQSGSPQ